MNPKNNDICTMKKRIAVVMGGTTSEHSISLKSGAVVLKHLPKDMFDVTAVIVSKSGWFAQHHAQDISIDQDTFSYNFEGKTYSFDAVFNAVHGTPGENGELQNILDNAKIPYTGCSADVAKLSYNKHETLAFLAPHGIAMSTNKLLQKEDVWSVDQLVKKIGLPCFVKANKAGSSYGVVKVHHADELEAAIHTAFLEDDQVLVESYLQGTEVSIGVIEYQNEIVVLPPTEIIANGDFFDYQAKYEGNSKEITPARLSEVQLEHLKTAAKKVFTVLNAKGFSRSDFIFQGDIPYFLELNSIPGLTEESLLPQQAKYVGIKLGDLFTDMLHNCLKNNTFDT
jgi:D-alanine-D-alanine ligase